MSTYTLRVSMVSFPPYGIASQAFTVKFKITCFQLPRVRLHAFQIHARNKCIFHIFADHRPSILVHLLTIWFRSKTFASNTCLRLKTSNCLVSAVARSAAL